MLYVRGVDVLHQDNPAAGPPGRDLLAAALLLLAASLGAHANTLANGFVWDDEVVVLGTPESRDLSRLATALTSPDEVRPYYRPLTRASFLVDHALWGLDARGFHAVNVAIHALNVLLLFVLGRRLFGRTAPALLAGLLLAVHPLHTESTAFLSGRNNLFALLFSLSTFLLFLEAERRGSPALAAASGLSFLLGLGSKEQAVMAGPLVVAWALRPGGALRVRGWRAGWLLAPLLAAALVYLALRSVALGSPGALPAASTSLAHRLVETFLVVPRYLGLAAFPAGLTIFHSTPRADAGAVAVAGVAWAAVAAAAVALLRRPTPTSRVGLSWLVLFFLPVANLVPIPSATMAERFVYLPAAGLWLLVADGTDRLYRRFPRRTLCVGLWAAALLALAARTVVRNRDWRDDLALARAAVAVDPRSVPALFNLGVVLKDGGDLAAARQQWDLVLGIDPGNGGALAQLGTLSALAGDLATAERHFRAALASRDAPPLARYNLGLLCERTGRLAEALTHYQDFLELVDRPEGDYRVGVDWSTISRARERVAALRAASLGPSAPPPEGEIRP